MKGAERTTISIKKSTYNRLKKYGNFGETHDSLINRILDELEKGGGSFAKREKRRKNKVVT
ncbi:MAG: hypothetical protein QW253_00190 [Metallosphaera sp.]